MDNLQLRSIVQFSTQQPDKKAKEREMRMLIAKDMAYVLTECNSMTVRWKASKTDLMEALHWTWMNDTVAAADGSPCLFRQQVSRYARADAQGNAAGKPMPTVRHHCGDRAYRPSANALHFN